MKGNAKLIEVLNQLLADELTAISQYMVHSEMCDSWGYEKLHKAIILTFFLLPFETAIFFMM